MNLTEALNAKTEKVIALVGGGGKTSTMYGLGRELANLGARVIVTTTTHIYQPTPGQSDVNIYADGLADLLAALETRPSEPGVVGVGMGVKPDGTLLGIPAPWVGELTRMADYVIVEADGSKGRPLKAPAAHEPVIPGSATLVIAVVGIDAVGLALTEENVHRPERVSSITGIAPGSPITSETVASVITHAEGLAKGMPDGARLVAFLNRIQDARHLDQAREIAYHLIDHPRSDGASPRRRVERVVIGCALEPDPVLELHVRVNEGAVR